MAADVATPLAAIPTAEGATTLDTTELPDFDPAIHLAFQPPAQRHTFSEVGLPKPHNAPDLCYTDPFPLFSEEGVRILRREMLDKRMLDKYLRSWDRAPAYIAGHEKTAKFMLQAWQHPATQAAIDRAAGFPLRRLYKTGDIGMVNIQLGPDGLAGVYKLTETPLPPQSPLELKKSEYDNVPIDSWHKDQVPVVCVVMLSDTSAMQGGETAIRTGDGSIVKVKSPTIGGAVIMQGGCTEHAALRATNVPERISMVTSYTFADPNLDDRYSSLRSVDPANDDIPLMCNLFLKEKLIRLQGRIDLVLAGLAEKESSGEMIEREEVERWVKEQMDFLRRSAWEMFERIPNFLHKDAPEEIIRGYLN
ncbi:uncharacterized protein Z519_04084 [Cladophialophora bantiana CBS 173.52]|uniref:Fe2OG dioxygenase domain-containing protein n=1 Tax=Cladophialophora bantiana (strain ATCC 10958 / CBS 173.52 / CDC B-1940 / NIH 8579) TaxID=1442370 RepID=A0A0D2IFH0_CLAB1|nr:uncharacterized protein Z519_04084 [Cladophialophora bantiana CBS 173.52]KIW95499.1 hypothetical protein Z519_04084 [Cladophialophora bantiana CBS 173.52]